MAEDFKVHMGEGSPESVALKLWYEILGVENDKTRDRKYLLDLYAECVEATKGFRARK